MSRHYVTPEENARIIELYHTGIGCKKIGVETKIPWQTVMRHVYRSGLMRKKADSHMMRRKVDHASLVADYKSGLCASKCASKHGCSISAAIRIAEKYGVSRTLSESRRGKLNSFYGKSHTEATKNRISTALGGKRMIGDGRRQRLHPILLIREPSWLKGIIVKRGYKCQICGRGGTMAAHHLDNVADHLSGMWDENNVVVICQATHLDFHRWMGGWYKSCTQADWLRYVEVGHACIHLIQISSPSALTAVPL